MWFSYSQLLLDLEYRRTIPYSTFDINMVHVNCFVTSLQLNSFIWFNFKMIFTIEKKMLTIVELSLCILNAMYMKSWYRFSNDKLSFRLCLIKRFQTKKHRHQSLLFGKYLTKIPKLSQNLSTKVPECWEIFSQILASGIHKLL